ncbi:DNA-directed RNA polymerase III subunit RPC8-like [Sycon ciliatum]|uniref:DNA-directed RNA polymerase III subunit RPC8-like n=1 Tax=Sycon ciliatum TaxID=27933 RepID=UPI0020AE81A6|eukprot:scpid2798/ scgid12046/ DNA-directed RNA polymerase III subunit RPC8; DNA-directed RNA polymerase III subunit H; RNA polymerase III subunit 22.9 kDa subunit
MFVLVAMKDLVEVKPWKFAEDRVDTVSSELNKKLANKVIHNVGLCISLYDITVLGDAMIYPGKGSCHVKVEFRFIVLRPFVDEVILGEVRSCSPEGVNVSMGFDKKGSMFDDIFIPADYLPNPSRFNREDNVWAWEYPTEDGASADLCIYNGEKIRFRVISETFVDCTPSTPELAGAAAAAAASGTPVQEESRIPYSLTGSISEAGLGLLSWWQ